MTMARGFFAHGATISYKGYSIGGAMDIPLPEEAREEVEVTDQDSDFNREFVPGLKDNGTLDLVLRMIPSDEGQQQIRASAGDPEDIGEIIITLPAHANPRLQWTFDAWVQTTGGTLYWENTAAERTVTFRITGGVTESELSV